MALRLLLLLLLPHLHLLLLLLLLLVVVVHSSSSNNNSLQQQGRSHFYMDSRPPARLAQQRGLQGFTCHYTECPKVKNQRKSLSSTAPSHTSHLGCLWTSLTWRCQTSAHWHSGLLALTLKGCGRWSTLSRALIITHCYISKTCSKGFLLSLFQQKYLK